MTSDPDNVGLGRGEEDAIRSLLSTACEQPIELIEIESVENRSHVLRICTQNGPPLIVKRSRANVLGTAAIENRAFNVEATSLEFLSQMPDSVAPVLVGSDCAAGVLLMEELAPGHSLADSLLNADVASAESDVIAYIEAMAALHAWSIGRTETFARLLAVRDSTSDTRPRLVTAIELGRTPLLGLASSIGIATNQVHEEIDEIVATLSDGPYQGFVHGDLCPDNVRISDGSCRIFDFERACVGSIALDVANLLAPFPSCWCFASLPTDIVDLALENYRTALAAYGITLASDWNASLAAALGGWIVARGGAITGALERDRTWGTTTMRSRLLVWMQNFVESENDAFPRLRLLVHQIYQRLISSPGHSREP